MGIHAGQFLYDFPGLLAGFVSGPSPAYLFSKPLNRLEFDPSYPRNPRTLGDYIRKWRMDKGVSQVELASRIGVNEMTIVNWEVKGRVPRIRNLRERLTHEVEGVERFLHLMS
jgi:DNA-binding XRE family transcriptional regulator